MKQEFIETYSLQDLAKKGYKESEQHWYLGIAKYPTVKISKNLSELLGKKFRLLNVEFERYGGPRYEVEWLGEVFLLPQHVVKTKVKKRKTMRMIVKNQVAKFNGFGFNFPCECRDIGVEETRKLAQWVLKVTK